MYHLDAIELKPENDLYVKIGSTEYILNADENGYLKVGHSLPQGFRWIVAVE